MDRRAAGAVQRVPRAGSWLDPGEWLAASEQASGPREREATSGVRADAKRETGAILDYRAGRSQSQLREKLERVRKAVRRALRREQLEQRVRAGCTRQGRALCL